MRSAKVENLLWGRYGRAKAHDYRHHARMLRTNLSHAGNAELRARVLSGELKPEVGKLGDPSLLGMFIVDTC